MSFSFERLNDPSYFAENRRPAHSAHAFYQNRIEMAAGETALKYSLNGVWKFFHARNEQQVIPGFEAAGYDCHPWADIRVPAHIQMEGYGVPQYANVQYPWIGSEMPEIGKTPEIFNPVACYAKYFFVPAEMKGKRVFISFQGVESCIALWLNGRYVGFAGDTFTPSEFELTDYLVEGENKLACRVYRWCQGSWLEDQDFYRFSGIYRDVILYAIPEAHIEDIKVLTDLNADLTAAVLKAALKTEGAPCAVSAKLMLGDTVIAEKKADAADGAVSFDMAVEHPLLWSSEYPNLYKLDLEVSVNGAVVEVISQNVGFRRFEMINGIMHHNGKRIVFKGTNRHDFCAETGRAVTKEEIRRDLLCMKRNNINAIRTCHYPSSEYLYELCDELGLYLIAENNMESHGCWDMVNYKLLTVEQAMPGNRTEWLPMLLDRVHSTYERDKNHPAVVIWSCGNESFGGDVIYEMSAEFRRLDPTRLVHYEGVHWDPRRPETTDMYSEMYTPVSEIRQRLAENTEKPFILCEYTHAMGNSNGAMHWYTEYAYEEPRYQGGFIWDYIDQAIRVKDRFGNTAYYYGGNCDDRPHDGNFSGNGIAFADGTESPKMQEVRYNYQNISGSITADEIVIDNRSMFTPVSDFRCVAKLERDGVEVARKDLTVDAAPLSKAVYPNPFAGQQIGGEYALTLSFLTKEDKPWAPAGHEAAFLQGVWQVEKPVVRREHHPLKVVQTIWNISVIGENFRVQFSLLQGGMNSYEYGGVEMLKAMVMPNFWRAPNDNDRGNRMPMRYAQWKIASLYAVDRSMFRPREDPLTRNADGTVTIHFTYDLPTTPAAEVGIDYTICPCGTVKVHMHYDPVEGLGDMPCFGMMLRLDADRDRVRWYGYGPDENYWDRHEGARLGIFSTTVKDNVTPYLKPQECGNRTGVRWAEITDSKRRGLKISGDGIEFAALPCTPHELESALHPGELPPAHYTILTVNKRQMGVAGDNSWGARTHPEYLIDVSKPVDFTFAFCGI